MNRGIYSLAAGMVASQQSMDVVSNNLANINTSGFKRDQLVFDDALQQALNNASGNSIGMLGSGPAIKQQFTDQTQGAINETKDPLNVAIEGKGMFAVQGPNGQILYTRNGAFRKGDTGNLETSQGYAVLDPAMKPILLRQGAVGITSSGSVSVGSDGQPYATIGVFQGSFAKAEAGLYRSADAAPAQPSPGTTRITQGALEASNVNPITSMVEMISLGRNFDMAQKSIQSEDDMTQKLTSTLS